MQRMRLDALAIAVTLLGVALFGAGPARADDTHHHDYPVGGRSLGLGGAFTALGDDPSGIFFNPAGTVDITLSAIQVSTNLYGLEMSDGLFGALDRVQDLDTVMAELNIIPSGAGGVHVLERGVDGRPQTVLGLGVFIPSYRSSVRQSLTNLADDGGSNCRTLAYRRDITDRTAHAIASLGYRVTPRLSLGISATAIYRGLRDTEETSCFSLQNADGISEGFYSAETNLNLTVISLLLGLSAKLQLSDRWFVGASLSSPSLRAYGSASLRVQRGMADEEDRGFSIHELNRLSADTAFGGTLRVGGAYVIREKFTMAADLALYAGSDYTLFQVPVDDRKLPSAITLVRRVDRRPVVNANLGAEYYLWPTVTLAGGLYTNFSSAAKIPGPIGAHRSKDQLPHVHTFGSSLVLGYIGEHTVTRVGGTLSLGQGTDMVPVYEGLAALGATPEFVKVKLGQMFVFFFVSSSFRY